ncbi:MAG: hypothetical protein U0232_15955 [Thermomicrobiales bacterium]
MFLVIRSAQHYWLAEFGDRLTLSAHDLPALLAAAPPSGQPGQQHPDDRRVIGLLGNADPAAREPLALAAVLGTNLGPTVTFDRSPRCSGHHHPPQGEHDHDPY